MSDGTHTADGDEARDAAIERRRFVQGVGAMAALAAGGAGTAAAQQNETDGQGDGQGGGQGGPAPAGALLGDLPTNWGRWGEDDELGALNLLGASEMAAGMEAAMQGGADNVERFTLQTPITGNAVDALIGEGEFPTTDTGDPAFPGRMPARRDNEADWRDAESYAGMRFADDKFVAPLFLQGTSHTDALGHGFFADDDVNGDGTIDQADEQLYNGFMAETTASTRSYEYPVTGLEDTDGDGSEEAAPIDEVHQLERADITNAANAGIQGRAVLLDVGRHLGDDNGWLPLNYGITLEDLQATADAQGVEVQERDILLIRTGAIERVRDPEAAWHAQAEPGLTYSDQLVEWVATNDIPYIAADNLPVEKAQHEVTADDLADGREDLAGTYVLPLHGAFLRNLGVTLNEVLDLSELAAASADDGVYTFLFTGAPLNVEGATGAPINPVVTKSTVAVSDDNGGGSGGEGTTNDEASGSGTDTQAEMDETTAETDGGNGPGFGVLGGLAGLAGAVGAKRFLSDDEAQ